MRMLHLCCLSLFCAFPSHAGTLATFRTAVGDIEVELYDADKPATVANFMRYVESDAYTNMFIHRWETNFVIQGGGYYVTQRHQTNAQFASVTNFPAVTNEYGVGRTFSNSYGTIAMARISGQTNSATSEWFFNLANNAFLDTVDGGFTVFGHVVRGTNVLERFNSSAATNGIFLATAGGPLTEIPVLSMAPSFEDLIYVDVSLLRVQVAELAGGAKEISWQSVSNKLNRVEFSTQVPPQWQELVSTNGTGQQIKIADSSSGNAERVYRVRVEY